MKLLTEIELMLTILTYLGMQFETSLLLICLIGKHDTRQPNSACGTLLCTLHKTYIPVLSRLYFNTNILILCSKKN